VQVPARRFSPCTVDPARRFGFSSSHPKLTSRRPAFFPNSRTLAPSDRQPSLPPPLPKPPPGSSLSRRTQQQSVQFFRCDALLSTSLVTISSLLVSGRVRVLFPLVLFWISMLGIACPISIRCPSGLSFSSCRLGHGGRSISRMRY